MSIRLPENLKQTLKRRAEINRRTLGAETVYLVERALEFIEKEDNRKVLAVSADRAEQEAQE